MDDCRKNTAAKSPLKGGDYFAVRCFFGVVISNHGMPQK